jgi:L-alanine-DL-glutamate epimerase-like enolase superfamily enzyme
MELAGSLRVSLSNKQAGHLGWLEVGQARMGITVVSASRNPAMATVSDGHSSIKIRLKEPVIKPLDLIEEVRNRHKSDADISIDATMLMSYQRVEDLRKERARKRREARLKHR